MQSLHTGYTQYFNLKYHKAGHLFQGRYKAIVCEKDSYILQLVRYIHQNPLRASIVENLEEYPWSSHHTYTGTREYVFLDTHFVLSLFGHTLSSARIHYLRFMNKIDEDFSSKVYAPVLGDEPFIDKIAVTYRHVLPDKKPQNISMPLSRIVGIACEVLKINESLIYSPSRHQTVAFARGIIATIAIDYAHISLKDVANFLNRDPSSVLRISQKIRAMNEGDGKTRDLFNSMVSVVTERQ